MGKLKSKMTWTLFFVFLVVSICKYTSIIIIVVYYSFYRSVCLSSETTSVNKSQSEAFSQSEERAFITYVAVKDLCSWIKYNWPLTPFVEHITEQRRP